MNTLSQTEVHTKFAERPRPWVLSMVWHDLLFMHWPVPAALLRPLLPDSLEIDSFEGTAWLGVVPFRMSDMHPRYLPALPWLSSFAEINLRTYVSVRGARGVWFFSLDAANPLAVSIARAAFYLPYFTAKITASSSGGQIHYASERSHRGAPPAGFRASYAGAGDNFKAARGSLEYFLTERYCFFSADGRGSIWRTDISHDPWPLQPAEAEVAVNAMSRQIDVAFPDAPPLLYFAKRLKVLAWLPVRV